MGFLDKILGGKGEEIDIEEFLNSIGEEGDIEEEESEAQRYVKPMSISSAQDFDAIMSEINKGNIILLNVRSIASKNTLLLKNVVSRIKESVLEIGGDIARITEYHLIVTPPGIKIVKRRSR